MNFFFMLTLILIILIFIKIKIKIIPNNAFLGLLFVLLIINEIYHYKFKKEQFNPYIYDGTYDKYYKNNNYLHMSDSGIDNLGLMCSLNKNVSIKKIQDNKFNEYGEFKNELDNVVYGDNHPDNVKMPNNFGDITKENKKIERINKIICPPVCHLIVNEGDCNNAVDYREILENEDKIKTTAPVFNDKKMLRHSYECLKSNPCDTNNGCVQVDNMCIYNKKKCEYDSKNNKCRQKCEIFESQSLCSNEYCRWNKNDLKCENKN